MWTNYSGYETKNSIFLHESKGKTERKIVDCFLISFLVPEIPAFKEAYDGNKSGSPIVETFAKMTKIMAPTDLHVSGQIIKSATT